METSANKFLSIVFLAALVLLALSCGKDERTASQSMKSEPLANKDIEAFKIELLGLAFDAATAIPVHPHIKDRSRAQEAVVVACLELEQPFRALSFIEKIEDWRRGAGYADLAIYSAMHGHDKDIQRFLDLAEKVSETNEDWRKDRIRAKIAQTYTILGRDKEAEKYSTDLENSETGKTSHTKAKIGGEEDFGAQVRDLDALLAPGNFDITQNALRAYVQVYGKYYENPGRRELVEKKIKEACSKQPEFYRFQILLDMGDHALAHGDNKKALDLVNEARLILDMNTWHLEHQLPMIARMVRLRFGAGETERAKSEADEALALFEKEKESVVNIYRAGALRPLAQAYQFMGLNDAALAVFNKTVDEGLGNINSRPRAEDLSATLVAMAESGFEPDAALWEKVRQIGKGLGEPW